MNDKDLMQQIKNKYGAIIDAEAEKCPDISAAFVAALIAGESGGDPNARRFESKVFSDLAAVLCAQRPAYGSIGAEDLMAVCWPADKIGVHTGAQPSWGLREALQTLQHHATSWGLTQIMGYHALAEKYAIDDLLDPAKHLDHATEMVADFVIRFKTLDPADWFRCWNTGSPNGKTFDPFYVSNGINRMEIYKDLQ